MTLYCKHNNTEMTLCERSNGFYSVRLQRTKNSRQVCLFIQKGDVLNLTTRSGTSKVTLKVMSFVPHIRYGHFITCGHVVPEWLSLHEL